MTTQELKQYIDKVLGNSIRCLLPSYWWKRLFNQVADRIDEVEQSTSQLIENKVNEVKMPIVESVDELEKLNVEKGGVAAVEKVGEPVIVNYEDCYISDDYVIDWDKYTIVRGVSEIGELPLDAESGVIPLVADKYNLNADTLVVAIDTGVRLYCKYQISGVSILTLDKVNEYLASGRYRLVEGNNSGIIAQYFTFYSTIPQPSLYIKGDSWERLAKESDLEGIEGGNSIIVLDNGTTQKNADAFKKILHAYENDLGVLVLYKEDAVGAFVKQFYTTRRISYANDKIYLNLTKDNDSSDKIYQYTLSANGKLSYNSSWNETTIDEVLSETSTNAIQNKAVYAALQNFANDFQFSIDNLSESDRQISQEITTINEDIVNKQDKLVSGTNIKTINGTSLLGGGDVTIVGEKGEKGDQGPAGPQGNSAFDGNGVEIVNNLTQGGEAAVLSAEQGKILDTKLAKVSVVLEEINGVEKSYDSSVLTPGGLINSETGEIVTNIYRSYTDFLPIVPNAELKFTAFGTSASPQGYAFYDRDKTFLNGKSLVNGSVENISVIAPEYAYYIRVTFVEKSNAAYDSFSCSIIAHGDIAKIEEQVDSLSTFVDNNEEFIRAYIDANGNFVWGIRIDGTIEWAKGIPAPIKEALLKLNLDVENLSNILDAFSPILTTFSTSDYQGEFSEITVDANGKILSWRDGKGVKHEVNLMVERSISLGKGAAKSLVKALQEDGFKLDNPIDHSEEESIALPVPRYCAKVNIISPGGLAVAKTQNLKCELEYFDKSGNYFKKPIISNAQGSSSMAYIEKNQSIDIYNDEAREDSCDITFGNWVAQDSYHLKSFYIDVFRGISNVAYNYCEEVIRFLNCRNNRIVFDRDEISTSESTGDFATDFGDGALCHPDGFPFEMYVNGEYYGLYAWNLKKHRKNYSMNKNDYSQALLDGRIDDTTFFQGNIDWTAFEFRNPKDLVTMDGREYDADTNCNELIDASSAVYNSSNSVHVKTANIKSVIKELSQALPRIHEETDISSARDMFESYFDVDAIICYYVISNVLHHYDGFSKNWIWTVYNGKAAPSFYDMDSIFGRSWKGTHVEPGSIGTHLGINDSLIVELVRLYKERIDETYASLRAAKIIDVDNIMRYVWAWVDHATLKALKKNIEQWTSIPSYRAEKNQDDGTYEGGFFDSPRRINKWLIERLQVTDNIFNYTTI